MHRRFVWGTAAILVPAAIAGVTMCTPRLLGQTKQAPTPAAGLPNGPATLDQVMQGRYLVTTSVCSGCHSHGVDDPNDPEWLAGYQTTQTDQPFHIGPFLTYASNLTPDMATGIGQFNERQIFNALRFGLDPSKTPAAVITANVPGQGNFPAMPVYLAPPMPWPSFRNKTDADLWAIVAYLKHGIRPVSNKVPDSQGPPDNWASAYTAAKIGPYPLPGYPAGSEALQP